MTLSVVSTKVSTRPAAARCGAYLASNDFADSLESGSSANGTTATWAGHGLGGCRGKVTVWVLLLMGWRYWMLVCNHTGAGGGRRVGALKREGSKANELVRYCPLLLGPGHDRGHGGEEKQRRAAEVRAIRKECR